MTKHFDYRTNARERWKVFMQSSFVTAACDTIKLNAQLISYIAHSSVNRCHLITLNTDSLCIMMSCFKSSATEQYLRWCIGQWLCAGQLPWNSFTWKIRNWIGPHQVHWNNVARSVVIWRFYCFLMAYTCTAWQLLHLATDILTLKCYYWIDATVNAADAVAWYMNTWLYYVLMGVLSLVLWVRDVNSPTLWRNKPN